MFACQSELNPFRGGRLSALQSLIERATSSLRLELPVGEKPLPVSIQTPKFTQTLRSRDRSLDSLRSLLAPVRSDVSSSALFKSNVTTTTVVKCEVRHTTSSMFFIFIQSCFVQFRNVMLSPSVTCIVDFTFQIDRTNLDPTHLRANQNLTFSSILYFFTICCYLRESVQEVSIRKKSCVEVRQSKPSWRTPYWEEQVRAAK